jgi:DNA topoisomerase-1
MQIVVVESPAKAKTINKYLGPGYKVIASFGHVRDLPPKDGSVRPDEDFDMDWEVDNRAEARLKEIAQAVKSADQLILATDPDREGEAISWHIAEELRRRKVLGDVDVKRVVFNEVTKSAVLDAMKQPRELNQELIEAYLARRALDYLVGFTLSPVLWRKLPGSRSAGRVQSVALRLICEREAEIEAFKPREYWTIEAVFKTGAGDEFKARLTHLDGRKLDKFDLPTREAAEAAVARIVAGAPFHVASVERKTVKRNPSSPFTTSTLQQEASRKLGLSASRTMRIAQKLYEGINLGGDTVGLITYMRTDGVALSNEAIASCRFYIDRVYGMKYLPETPRIYKSPAKNAQEAHEAIRPTDMDRRPQDVARYLDPDEQGLYELIWKRTLASQMESAVLDQVAVDVAGADGKVTMRANGSVLVFDGFLTLYQEDRDDPSEDEEAGGRLPNMTEGQPVTRDTVTPEQHFTQPPPRYSEASLVKRLEELGIGRPSTYASILQVLQDRKYVKLEKRRFIPEDRGRLVTAFLTSFFEHYFAYDFTALLEEQLDDISGGRIAWKKVLRDFWASFSESINGTKDLSITQVIDSLDADLGPHFFPANDNGHDPRVCPGCKSGRLGLRLGKFGAFIGCSNYPECRYTRRLGVDNGNGANGEHEGPKLLGNDPTTGLPVTLRHGPYGYYVQLGDGNGNGNGDGHAEPKKKGRGKAAQAAKEKPKRASLPRGTSPADMTLERAVGLLSLPRTVGTHPESAQPITAGLGRFGPYLKHGDTYKSLRGDDDVLTIGLNRAVTLLAEPSKGGRRSVPGKILGNHPADGEPITLHSGRYGPYVRHGKTLASLPGGSDPDAFTLDDAVALVTAKAEKAKGGAKKAKSGGSGTKSSGKARKAKAAAGASDDGAPQPANSEPKRPARKRAVG